MVGNIG